MMMPMAKGGGMPGMPGMPEPGELKTSYIPGRHRPMWYDVRGDVIQIGRDRPQDV